MAAFYIEALLFLRHNSGRFAWLFFSGPICIKNSVWWYFPAASLSYLQVLCQWRLHESRLFCAEERAGSANDEIEH